MATEQQQALKEAGFGVAAAILAGGILVASLAGLSVYVAAVEGEPEPKYRSPRQEAHARRAERKQMRRHVQHALG